MPVTASSPASSGRAMMYSAMSKWPGTLVLIAERLPVGLNEQALRGVGEAAEDRYTGVHKPDDPVVLALASGNRTAERGGCVVGPFFHGAVDGEFPSGHAEGAVSRGHHSRTARRSRLGKLRAVGTERQRGDAWGRGNSP